MRYLLLLIATLTAVRLSAQNHLNLLVIDSATSKPIAGASVINKETKTGKSTRADGKVVLSVSDTAGRYTISAVNYAPQNINIASVQTDTTITVLLSPSEHQLEEVIIVSSSRTNSRLEDLPTRVEVLGAEEVNEENGIKPGNIASLLGDIAGVQIQQTSAATGNADMRIQGVPGKYTQLLRDGIPLFSGYGGSFSILQIPPLDLQQIELIKGASSTLYGGGAIAGMVNLISKKPVAGKPVKSFTLNRSTLKENNLNAFISGRNANTGYTLYAGGNLQQAVDVNKDGFSDVPDVKSVFIHPRFFLYNNISSTLVLGYTLNYEDRKGGDMLVLNSQKNNEHQFFIQNKSLRNTVDVIYDKKILTKGNLSLKGSTSFFNRDISTNIFGMKANQTSWFSEAAYSKKGTNATFVMGLNWNGESFRKGAVDSSSLADYNNYTLGAFAQGDFKIAQRFTAQTGLRVDYVNYAEHQKAVILPRLSLMYKFNTHFTARAGGGLGYKIPTVFNAEVDERDYHYLLPIEHNNRLERSAGLNADINYKTKISGWDVTVNQGFYLTRIKSPLVSEENGRYLFYANRDLPIVSKGTETYIQLRSHELEIYLGYTYTNAIRKYDLLNKQLPLTAKHKLASVVAFEIAEKFRAGIEAAYTGKQYLEDGRRTDDYLFLAAMLRYSLKPVAFVLNFENLSDYRQSKKEPIVYAPNNNPSFPEIWAPLEGRVINLSMNVTL